MGKKKNNATRALAKMNMILHGDDIADIRQGGIHYLHQNLKKMMEV